MAINRPFSIDKQQFTRSSIGEPRILSVMVLVVEWVNFD